MQNTYLEFRETNDFQRMMSLPLVWEKNELFDDLPKKGDIDLEEWGTQGISCKVNVESTPFELVFSQNLHEDWFFFLNGERMKTHSEFDALMGIDIESPGVYDLEIRYSNRQYKKGLWMTFVGWLVLLGTIVCGRFRN